MTTKRRQRKTTPVIFVFCEGETEKCYIDMLRRGFRANIQIIPRILNTKISQRLVDKTIKDCGYSDVDRVFLFYDGDRKDINDKLLGIKNADVMLSCPCVELWFLLHFVPHRAYVSSENAVTLLQKHVPEYRKGEIKGGLKEKLLSCWEMAAVHAKCLESGSNPSSTAYILPEYLMSVKNVKKG